MPEVKRERNAYSVLGLHKGASEDEIKQAYVALVKKYDPEVHTERFMIVQGAFEKLKNPAERAREDILTYNFLRGDFNFGKGERVEISDSKLAQGIQTLEQKRTEDGSYPEEIRPKLAQAYLIRAKKNIDKKLLKEAIDDWMRVLTLDPTHFRSKNNLLNAFIRLGRSYADHHLHEEAIELWEKAAKMDPDNVLVLHNLAICCEEAGALADSKRYWDETLRRWKAKLERDPEDEYLKNCVIEANRHLSELDILKTARKAAELASQSTPAASPQPSSAPADAPSAPSTLSADAPTPTPKKQPARATPKASSDPPAPKKKPTPPAEDDLTRNLEILRLKPDDFDASMRVGHLLMERKLWNDAVKHFRNMRKLHPKDLDVLNSMAWAFLQNQEVDRAIRIWDEALKLDPKSHTIREAKSKAHMMLGRGLRDKNLFINALVHFKALTRLNPDSDEVHFELGKTYQLQGDLRSAFGEFKKVVKLNPKHKFARKSLSELRMQRT